MYCCAHKTATLTSIQHTVQAPTYKSILYSYEKVLNGWVAIRKVCTKFKYILPIHNWVKIYLKPHSNKMPKKRTIFEEVH